MFGNQTDVAEQLSALEAALGLTYDGQDWGIVNADAERVTEFVDFFERNYDQSWSRGAVSEFVDLVMQSAEWAVHQIPGFELTSIDRFVAVAAPITPGGFKYWMPRNQKVASHLRSLGL